MMSNSLPSVPQLPRLITDVLTVQEARPSLTTNDLSPSKKLPDPVIPSKTILEISETGVLKFPNYYSKSYWLFVTPPAPLADKSVRCAFFFYFRELT